MRGDAVVRWALVALVAGLVVAGLLTVGGPGKGRQETRDRTRLSDLNVLEGYVRCVADTQGGRLPQSLAPVETCQRDMRLHDPFTDAPYRYEVVSDTAFRLCADFEDPDWLAQGMVSDLDPATGCIQSTHTARD